MEPAFVIKHFAGKVKYHVKVRMVIREFKKKCLDVGSF